MNLFSRAARNLPLTPGERAFLKLLKGWIYTAVAAGIAVGVQYLYNNQMIDWQKLGYLIGGAFMLSLLTALEKYFTAQGDPNLPQGQAQPPLVQPPPAH